MIKFFIFMVAGILSGQTTAQQVTHTSAFNATVNEASSQKYIRLAPDKSALQVAIVRFQKRSGEKSYYVDLVGAIHVADKTYYDDLNKRFKDYDAVLYELVAPEGTKIPYQSAADKADSSEKTDWQRSKSPITAIQTMMKDVLGLRFQMDAVDYSSDHFIHADFSPKEFADSMDDRGETIFGMIIQLWRAGLAQQLTAGASSDLDLFQVLMAEDKQLALKQLMAEEFAGAESVMSAFEGAEGSTLVAARNQKALQVLSRTLVDKHPQSVAIFYGAGHMQDFQQRLMADFDLVPVSIEWVDAWLLTE